MSKDINYASKQYNKILNEYLHRNRHYVLLSSDNDPGNEISQGIAKRDSRYTELLGNYVKLTKRRNVAKEIHKWVFFWLILAATIVTGYFLIRFVNISADCLLKDNNLMSNTLVAFVSSLTSLVAVIVSIPIIISKYLFNTNEDNNITKIIMGTQEHDSAEIPLLEERFKPKNDIEKKITENKESQYRDRFEKSYYELSEKFRDSLQEKD